METVWTSETSVYLNGLHGAASQKADIILQSIVSRRSVWDSCLTDWPRYSLITDLLLTRKTATATATAKVLRRHLFAFVCSWTQHNRDIWQIKGSERHACTNFCMNSCCSHNKAFGNNFRNVLYSEHFDQWGEATRNYVWSVRTRFRDQFPRIISTCTTYKSQLR
jgi:hypothetical protein